MNQSILQVFKARETLKYPNSQEYKVFCEFCGERCIMDSGPNGAKYYQCNHHENVAVKYLVGEHPDDWYTLVFACDKDKRYLFVSFFFNNNYVKEAFRIDEIFNKGKINCFVRTIFSLDFHPKDITPNNVIDKMSLWIPFS